MKTPSWTSPSCPVYFHFNLYSMFERFYFLSFLFLKKRVDILSLSRFFKGTSNTDLLLCNSQIWLLVRVWLFYFYFLFSIFVLSSSPPLLCSIFLTFKVLFLALHTLINEFFLFPSFPALAYFPIPAVSRLPRDFHLFFTLESPSSYPSLFLRQSRTVTTIHPSLDASQLLVFCHSCWTHELFSLDRKSVV